MKQLSEIGRNYSYILLSHHFRLAFEAAYLCGYVIEIMEDGVVGGGIYAVDGA